MNEWIKNSCCRWQLGKTFLLSLISSAFQTLYISWLKNHRRRCKRECLKLGWTLQCRQMQKHYELLYVSFLRREENQLDVTECFIALMIRSTCFGHFYVHHQELETICVLLPRMVCSAWLLVVGGQVQSSRLSVQEEGCCTTRATSLIPDA
jgi:hypothetical protein